MAGACASRSVSNVAGAASASGAGSFGNSSTVSKGASVRNVGGLATNSERKFMSWGGANSFSRSAKLRGNAQFSRGRFQAIRAVGLDGQSTQAGGGFVVTNEESVNSSYQWPDAKNPRICILGGGFGGLYTALRLESLTWAPDKRPQVLLIDQSDRFVFKPMLYEILSKEVDVWEIAPSFSELLSNTRVKFIKDSVKSVSPFDSVSGKRSLPSAAKGTGGTVFLDGGAQVDYDWLVLALGAESRLNFVPGAVEYALPFGTLEDALEVDRRIVALERERFGVKNTPIEVVIVGSGYCGIELAATLAERFGKRGKVQVVDPHPDICASAPAGNREVASRVLSSRDVQVELGYRVTSISESTTEGTSSEDNGSASSSAASRKLIVDMKLATQRQTLRNTGGRQLKADLVLWTIGSKASVPSRSDADYLAFPVNGRGQADTDDTLRVRGHPRIFAIGDSAGAKDGSGKPLPSTAQVAFQQADYAGWNIWAAINDRPLLPFRYQHLGEMMTLGTSNAAVTLGFIDNVTLDGLFGHSARKLAYLYRFPKDDHKAKVALSWLAKSTINTFTFIQDELTKVLSPS